MLLICEHLHVYFNTHAKLGKIPNTRSQNIERKRNSDINQGP